MDGGNHLDGEVYPSHAHKVRIIVQKMDVKIPVSDNLPTNPVSGSD